MRDPGATEGLCISPAFPSCCSWPPSRSRPRPRGRRASSATPSPRRTRGCRPRRRAGREIWMFATAFNDRFFTYSYPQRIGGGDRLVRVPARRPPGRPVRRLGRDPRSRLLRARRPRLPGALADRDLRAALVPGRRRAARLRRARGLRRPGLRLRGRAVRRLDAARRGRPAAVGLRPALRDLDGRARLPQVPEPAVRRRRLGADRRLGGLRRVPVRRPGRPGQPAEPALGRLGRAAGADRHGLRRLPHRLRPAEPAGRPRPSGAGRTSTRWSATSTAGCRTCSATGCRRTGSSGS